VRTRHCETLVLGIGNELFGDDGVGCVVARRVHAALPPGTTDLLVGAVGGYDVLDRIVGYRRVVLIDAVLDRDAPAGELRVLDPLQLPLRSDSPSHGVDLPTVLAAGRQLGAELPESLVVLGITVREAGALREGLGGELTARLDDLVAQVRSAISAETTDA